MNEIFCIFDSMGWDSKIVGDTAKFKLQSESGLFYFFEITGSMYYNRGGIVLVLLRYPPPYSGDLVNNTLSLDSGSI